MAIDQLENKQKHKKKIRPNTQRGPQKNIYIWEEREDKPYTHNFKKKKNDNNTKTKSWNHKSQIRSGNTQSLLKLNTTAKTIQKMERKLHIINYKLIQENNYLIQNLTAAA